ncbi:MAG: AraC family transcriptional regulator [Acidobacteriota bacterium]
MPNQEPRLGAAIRPRRARPRRQICRAIDFIEDHLDARLTLSMIAEASGLSRFHFLRVFKQATGTTPFAYLMRRRVERARRLIARGRPLADVAYSTGFADQAHLCRRFRQIVGMTPGEAARKALRTTGVPPDGNEASKA